MPFLAKPMPRAQNCLVEFLSLFEPEKKKKRLHSSSSSCHHSSTPLLLQFLCLWITTRCPSQLLPMLDQKILWLLPLYLQQELLLLNQLLLLPLLVGVTTSTNGSTDGSLVETAESLQSAVAQFMAEQSTSSSLDHIQHIPAPIIGVFQYMHLKCPVLSKEMGKALQGHKAFVATWVIPMPGCVVLKNDRATCTVIGRKVRRIQSRSWWAQR
jgi:hypothetical protein